MDATGINNFGQIVATGLNSASQEEAFLLTPIRGRARRADERPCRLIPRKQPKAFETFGKADEASDEVLHPF